MMAKVNEVQAVYGGMRGQQAAGKIAVTVIAEEGCAAMYEGARTDIEKIALAAGVEMLKTARVVARRAVRGQQETGLKELNTLLREIRQAKDKEDVFARAGIATGYANAMRHFDLMSENELGAVIDVIGQAGEQAKSRIEAASRPFWRRAIRKAVRV